MDKSKLIYMDFSDSLHGFVKIETWIFLSCYMDLSKLLHGFVKFVTWICQSCSRPLPNQSMLKFYQDFKACWSFRFELGLSNESNYPMPYMGPFCLWQWFDDDLDDDEHDEDPYLEMKERTPFKSERSAKFPENLGPLARSLFTSSQTMMMSVILMVMMKTMKMLTMVLSFWWSCWSSGVIANQHAWGAEEQIRASSQNSVPPSSPSVRFYSDLLLKKTQIQIRIQTQTNVLILATK